MQTASASPDIATHNRQILRQAVESLEAAGLPLPQMLQIWKTAEMDIAKREHTSLIDDLVERLSVAERHRRDADMTCAIIQRELRQLGWEG